MVRVRVACVQPGGALHVTQEQLRRAAHLVRIRVTVRVRVRAGVGVTARVGVSSWAAHDLLVGVLGHHRLEQRQQRRDGLQVHLLNAR